MLGEIDGRDKVIVDLEKVVEERDGEIDEMKVSVEKNNAELLEEMEVVKSGL